jgi:hypothetical protein
MTQIRLRNNTGGTSKIGQLVRVDPKSTFGFINVTDLSILPVIGTVAQAVPNGNSCLIDLINTSTMPLWGQVIYSPTPPINPPIGTTWIETSIT